MLVARLSNWLTLQHSAFSIFKSLSRVAFRRIIHTYHGMYHLLDGRGGNI